MSAIDIRGFLGIQPMVSKQSLPNENAQAAVNCRLEGGDLEAWNNPLQILALTGPGAVLSAYRFDINNPSETQYWFQFTSDVDVVKGPIDGDTEERTFWTGDGAYPKKTNAFLATAGAPYPTNHFRLGIPAPTAAPTISISGVASNANDPANTAAWGFTYVTTWNEEGPMSPLSGLATWRPGQTPQVANLGSAPPAGPYSIDRKRIYRSNSGSDTTDLQFVAEIAITASTFSDTVDSSALGAVSATRFWTPPPDNISGLCAMTGDILVAFYENTVRMSEPGVPYAWPTRYSYSFDSPVIGVKPYGQSVVVCCKRGTYVLTGTDPAAMQREDVKGADVCLSKRGMVQWLNGVVYPVKRGLQYVGADGVKLLTDGSFDEYKWAAYKPESFTAAVYADRYIAFYDTGTTRGSLVFTAASTPTIVESDQWATAVFTEKKTGALYVVQTGNNLKRWDGGTALTYRWRSKAYRYAKPTCMAWGRVEADTYPVTFRWFAAGVLCHTQTVLDPYAFPITQHDESKACELEVEGTVRVTAISVTTSIEEMKRL